MLIRTPYLSTHFSLAELTASQTAARNGLKNEPGPDALANLRRLAVVLEDVRTALLQAPMLVSSGFRSANVNALVGGAADSAHKDGRAADFTAPRFGSPRDVCQRIVDAGITFDQLIYEGTWVHIGIARVGEQPRRQVLTAIFANKQPTRYVGGLT
ncbi:D-Ala-D-Ala carboxypeptidase family metallohydrolase [Variovorax sp.]|uniref:D-Ala-D-Ala carboxypeptidase family metallohydrolase n=1 Tax=Variovorax sp. TaxID=1871043 RepID=UPI003BAB369F